MMTKPGSPARFTRRLITAATATALAAAALGASPSAVAHSGDGPGEIPGYVAPLPPKAEQPGPLLPYPGTVSKKATPKLAKPKSGRVGTTATIATSTKKVGLRALVIAVDESDYLLPTWTSTLDRVGAAYDVLHSKDQDLSRSDLVAADGSGKYNAILLTGATQAYADGAGNFISGMAPAEWSTLYQYEVEFGVRQATLFASGLTQPEDYCVRGTSEGGTDSAVLPANLTAAGATIFDYLKPSAEIPITESYVYWNRIATATDNPDCADASAILTSDGGVLGTRSTSADGRDRLALTFTSNQHLLQANLLAYGMFRWASRGLYFGEQRHYLEVDVDDWFNSSDRVQPTYPIDGSTEPVLYPEEFTMVPGDVEAASKEQRQLVVDFPLAGEFKLNIAYNGGDAVLPADKKCTTDLTSMSKCMRNEFRWINHTLTHPKMNDPAQMTYELSRYEIEQNLKVAKDLGFKVPKTVLKTGEYSGLGVYHPTSDILPPFDYNRPGTLDASNPELLAAAKSLGVRYLHGNMSFESHRPECFNCGVVHSMEPSITVVPDWPTNIAYFSTTPEEEAWFYNWFYGPLGRFRLPGGAPFFSIEQTYEQVIDNEATVALQHVTTGSIYSHTLHISNLYDYDGKGKGTSSLAFDWIRATVAKYSALYSVPLLSPSWDKLAEYVADRNGHFDVLGAGVTAVYDPATKKVTVVSQASGKLTVSGLKPSKSTTTYGTDVSGVLSLKRGDKKTVDVSPLP